MRDVIGPGTVVGYGTNVHAGESLAAITANLEAHALAVKARVWPDDPMGIGLWLPARAAVTLLEEGSIDAFRQWLNGNGLDVFTINGFPFGDFHQGVVKHEVYTPDWTQPERLDHTVRLAEILAQLIPSGDEGSISTLPIGWKPWTRDTSAHGAAATNLLRLVTNLAALEERTGRLIHVDLEPEPGCVLERSADVVAFFEQHLLRKPEADLVRRHLGVCHDVCHAAVMFEDQSEALDRYRRAGLRIGKVHLASAVHVPFDQMSRPARREAFRELRSFAEDRYLHQTLVRCASGEHAFFEDLPAALAACDGAEPDAAWRVHFHVPIFLDRFGRIETTQDEIVACLRALNPGDRVRHFEVETYAWGVLPPAHRCHDLADGLARELDWLRAHVPGPGAS